MDKEQPDTQKVKLAINSSQGSVPIGNFRTTLNQELNIYYNIDLGQYKESMYDTAQEKYENLRKIHFSLHDSGQGHLKPKKGLTSYRRETFPMAASFFQLKKI